MIYLNQCCCFLLPVVIITVCPNLRWSTDHWSRKYALTLLWRGRDSLQVENAKQQMYGFIQSAIICLYERKGFLAKWKWQILPSIIFVHGNIGKIHADFSQNPQVHKEANFCTIRIKKHSAKMKKNFYTHRE